MVVVSSGGWMKNAQQQQYGGYEQQQQNHNGHQVNDDDMVIPTEAPLLPAPQTMTMNAKAVLIGRPNSHPFQERTLCLDQPVKVGRSVARARATPTNAIFDCKVLSRHHALLWYDCGKFYLQDTKSSNGTFVNNNRLSSTESEPHEVSSGDIVQFGVDVVENNRKVTHGCIIATLKLYLPDGKEAKASPSIAEGNRHGLVPLDELYKLNQIIQEASQREQCLEMKLTALQHVVEAARRAADESWQAYVGEERLLSRVAALETQLVQANKGFGDDRLREELNKLQEDRAEYQIAAKEALRKLHAERLEAVAGAAEQQRARATAEHDAIIAKEQLELAQQELQGIAQKLSEEQKKSDEERVQLEQNERELQVRLEAEAQNVAELQKKLEYLRKIAFHPGNKIAGISDNYDLLYDEFSIKEDLIGENEAGQGDMKKPNGVEDPEQNHINLTVGPVLSETDTLHPKSEDGEPEVVDRQWWTNIYSDGASTEKTVKTGVEDNNVEVNESGEKEVGLVSEADSLQSKLEDGQPESAERQCWTKIDYDGASTEKMEKTCVEDETKESSSVANNVEESDSGKSGEKEDDTSESKSKPKHDTDTIKPHGFSNEIDARTLKYQYQTAQIELKKQIEHLEIISASNKTKIAFLEKSLMNAQEENSILSHKSDSLKHELAHLEKKYTENMKESSALSEKVVELQSKLKSAQEDLQKEVDRRVELLDKGSQADDVDRSPVGELVPVETLQVVEEELVALKERYAVANEEKLVLKRELVALKEKFNAMRDRSHNVAFFYVAPLVLMVLYLLISSMFS